MMKGTGRVSKLKWDAGTVQPTVCMNLHVESNMCIGTVEATA